MDKKKILTIDDDKDINVFLKDILSAEEYFVRTALTASEFFEEFNKFTPDLCIVDLNLETSKGAGYEILRAIRKKFGNQIKIVIVSRRFAEVDIQKGLDLGADDYITKPLDKTTVQCKINAVLGDMYKESSSLPYFAVPSTSRDSYIELDLNLVSLDEEGVTFKSFNFISKGNKIKMTGKLFQSISSEKFVYGTIESSVREEDSISYLITVKFDFDDLELMANVRRVLLGIDKI
ncbi:response regulator [Halobacteriovorax sp. JY17]|uniref:response regulator transcription factor n=1 Tax=Halobacteriovorax sp. JY17 TaxID=2014617 RepID=UPI000C47E1B3|nr:response regulator [Halobacteriovorax sp. JY17]PIK15338.1 MAG: hypothetical protein CES88_01085 [Halobacteriovorax sp. JY17]